MKSIKPGRGPSAMGAAGSIFVAIFGVFWTIMATNAGAPIFFTLFGIGFVIIAVIQGFYNFYNATNENRMSVYDITDENEESDPLQERLGVGHRNDNAVDKEINDANFCPYCGEPLHEEFSFCPKCGKRIRE